MDSTDKKMLYLLVARFRQVVLHRLDRSISLMIFKLIFRDSIDGKSHHIDHKGVIISRFIFLGKVRTFYY